MIAPIGDNANVFIPPHPVHRNGPSAGSVSWKITKFSGNALYWILQITVLILSVSFNILCNPIVWFLVKTIFNVLTEVFVYLVLGVCSVLISIITHIDDYYTKGKNQSSNQTMNTDMRRKDFQIQTFNVKRFVDKPKEY